MSSAPRTTALIILNDEMEDIIKIVKSIKDSGLLLKNVRETIQNKAKDQKGGFLSMLLGTLGASLLGNILADKRAITKRGNEKTRLKRQGRGTNRAGDGTATKKQGPGIVTAGHGNKMDF